jgi:hypothetical protein
MLALQGCRDPSLPELTVHDFLGPEPGKKYLYQDGEELRVEVVATERLSPTRIRLRETATLKRVAGDEISSTTVYDISAEGGRLTQESSRGADILLQEPIETLAGTWDMDFEVSSQNREKKALPATCRVVSVGESEVLGARVLTVTVECVSEPAVLSVVPGQQSTDQRMAVTRTFAKGVGLVSEYWELRIGSESVGGTTGKMLERIGDVESK